MDLFILGFLVDRCVVLCRLGLTCSWCLSVILFLCRRVTVMALTLVCRCGRWLCE